MIITNKREEIALPSQMHKRCAIRVSEQKLLSQMHKHFAIRVGGQKLLSHMSNCP